MWVLILPLFLCLNDAPCDPQIVEVAHYESKPACEAVRAAHQDTYCISSDALHGVGR